MKKKSKRAMKMTDQVLIKTKQMLNWFQIYMNRPESLVYQKKVSKTLGFPKTALLPNFTQNLKIKISWAKIQIIDLIKGFSVNLIRISRVKISNQTTFKREYSTFWDLHLLNLILIYHRMGFNQAKTMDLLHTEKINKIFISRTYRNWDKINKHWLKWFRRQKILRMKLLRVW